MTDVLIRLEYSQSLTNHLYVNMLLLGNLRPIIKVRNIWIYLYFGASWSRMKHVQRDHILIRTHLIVSLILTLHNRIVHNGTVKCGSGGLQQSRTTPTVWTLLYL